MLTAAHGTIMKEYLKHNKNIIESAVCNGEVPQVKASAVKYLNNHGSISHRYYYFQEIKQKATVEKGAARQTR